MKVYNKYVYLVTKNKVNSKALIIYNVSSNHYVGVPIYDIYKEGQCLYINSISKYIDITKITEYKKTDIKNNIYIKGKSIHVSDKEFNEICKIIKQKIIENINNKINYKNINNLKYIKWCYDKILIEEFNTDNTLKEWGVYWIDFGINIGSELRKLRPRHLMEK